MVKLENITEENWIQAARLSVTEEQQQFLDRPIGILARGYVYRDKNARVYAVSNGEQIVGITLVKDMDEEPVCYDLQQFLIDKNYQNKGYGTQALEQILTLLKKERKYDCVEVCVHKNDIPAIRLYEKAGFVDTGYVDEDIPDYRNLRVCFSAPLAGREAEMTRERGV